MTDASKPLVMMMDQAQEMAKVFNPGLSGASTQAMEKLWPTITKDMMEVSFGKDASQKGLDAKTRLLRTLAGLSMQGAQNETQLRMTVRPVVEAGATKDEVSETIAQMSMFAGLPAMSRAMELAGELLNETKETET